MDTNTRAMEFQPLELLLKAIDELSGNSLKAFEGVSANYGSRYRSSDVNEEFDFNVFELIASHYRHENLHSDLQKFFLERKNRNQDAPLLDALLSRIKQTRPHNLSPEKTIVCREKHRIDLLLLDEQSKECVIIESKINFAPDQEHQLPKYYEKCTAEGWQVKAIVYLTLDGLKQPDSSTWTEVDKKTINCLLLPLAAFNGKHDDLYSLWQPFLNEPFEGTDTSFVLKHYLQTLKTMGYHRINQPLMLDFYKHCLEDPDLYKNALSLSSLINDFDEARVELIHDYFMKIDKEPFTELNIYQKVTTYFNRWKIDKYDFALDVTPDKDRILVKFFERTYDREETKEDMAIVVLQACDLRSSFNLHERRWTKVFEFPQEQQKMLDFVTSTIEKFRLNQSKIQLEISKEALSNG